MVVQAPTGSGKTTAAFEEVARVLQTGMKAVYLCPLRALAHETSQRLRTDPRYGKIGVFTGESIATDKEIPFSEANLLIMTPERFDACTRAWRSHWTWIPNVDLVVIDELHLLGDARRGGRLEGGISRFRRLNPFAKLIGMSATLGNRTEVSSWLNALEVVSDLRPIPLSWKIVRYDDPLEKANLAREEIAKCVSEGGQSLVFVQSRRRAEALAEFLAIEGFRTAHHHGGLGSSRRVAVESQCRAGELDVVVATATLEMGLNLPVRQVLLYDLQRFDGVSMIPIDVTSVWQRAGRAGRPGLDTSGEVILLAHRRDKNAEHYENGKFEQLRSAFRRDSVLAEQIVADVSSGIARTPSQLSRSTQSTFGGSQSSLPVSRVLGEMIAAGMITQVHDEASLSPKLKATKLGKVVSRHMLSPRTVSVLKSILEKNGDSTITGLLFELATCEECEPHLFVDYEELEQLQPLLTAISDRTKESPKECAKRLFTTGRGLVSAAKKTTLLVALTSHMNSDLACEMHGCYPFEGERLRESMVRLLQALGDLAGILEGENKDQWLTRIRCLTVMIEGGMNQEAATLALVDGIGAKTATKLLHSGVKDIEDLALLEAEELSIVSGASLSRATKWVNQACDLVKTHGAYFFRENAIQSDPSALRTDSKVDLYRLRRALSLRVASESTGSWVVSGGSENRRVKRTKDNLICDCPDHAKGHECKHILAVRLKQKDQQIREIASRIVPVDGQWHATSLWMDKDCFELSR